MFLTSRNRALRLPAPIPAARTLWLAGFAIVSLWGVFLRALFAIAGRRRCRLTSGDVVERARRGDAARIASTVDVAEVNGISAPLRLGPQAKNWCAGRVRAKSSRNNNRR